MSEGVGLTCVFELVDVEGRREEGKEIGNDEGSKLIG